MCDIDTHKSYFQIPSIDVVTKTIADPNASIVDRVRCLFYARHHGGEGGVHALQKAIGDRSVLLAHEAAYVMGQIGEKCAIPCLIEILEDVSQHFMIRHEAAEALAAIGEESSIELLKKYSLDDSRPVAETCQLALRSLMEKQASSSIVSKEDDEEIKKTSFYLFKSPDGLSSTFKTVDPISKCNQDIKKCNIDELKTILHDEGLALYDRYEALFALRDMDTPQAKQIIVDAMKDKVSALFRHEVAFVLGQIQTPESVTALVDCLQNDKEDPMARHEAALALGSVGCSIDPKATEARRCAIDILLKYAKDAEPIVSESCLVGLDNIEKETGSVNLMPELCLFPNVE